MTVAPSAAELAALFAADGVVVFVNDGPKLTVADVWPANPAVASILRIPVGFGVTGLVARNGHPVLLGEDSRATPPTASSSACPRERQWQGCVCLRPGCRT